MRHRVVALALAPVLTLGLSACSDSSQKPLVWGAPSKDAEAE